MRSSLSRDGRDLDRRRAERDFQDNPPSFEPAQGDDGSGWNMDFGDLGNGQQSQQSSVDPFGGMSFGNQNLGGTSESSFSGTSMSALEGLNQMQNNMNMNQPAQKKKAEDVIVDVMIQSGKVGLKGLKGFIAEVQEALEDDKEQDMMRFGYKMSTRGLVLALLGGLAFVLSLFQKGVNTDYCLSLIVSGMTSFVIGTPIYMSKRASLDAEVERELNSIGNDDEEGGFGSEGYNNDYQEEPSFNDSNDDFSFDDDESDSSDDDFFSNWDEGFGGDDNDEVTVDENIDVDSMISNLDATNMPVNMYTRAYLVETFMKVLPQKNPNFSEMEEIPEGDDFYTYDDIICEIAERMGLPEEKTPRLLTLRENLFIVQLKLERPTGFNKEQAMADELASIYSIDQDTGRSIKGREGVYATTSVSGGYFFINMFICNNPPLITIGDIYSRNKDFIMDVKNKMPLIWGINELGDPITSDASSIDSMIISGMPRSGKSWKMQSLLLQLCMFSSPEEINIIVYDTKGAASDYYRISSYSPHFKEFRYTKETIIASLERLTTKERAKRDKIFAEYGVMNISDLHRRFPDAKVPYIYVVLDEMKSLVDSLTKEEANKFWELIGYVVTKMPNLGFRLICIPHRIVNEIIRKTVSQNIPTKACIRATKSDVVSGLDIKEKDFMYSLPNKGDMALKSTEIANGNPVYCHGEVITSTNETNEEIFRYVGEVWKRLCPGSEKDSVGVSKKVGHSAVDRSFSESSYNLGDSSNKNEGISVDDIEEGFWV